MPSLKDLLTQRALEENDGFFALGMQIVPGYPRRHNTVNYCGIPISWERLLAPEYGSTQLTANTEHSNQTEIVSSVRNSIQETTCVSVKASSGNEPTPDQHVSLKKLPEVADTRVIPQELCKYDSTINLGTDSEESMDSASSLHTQDIAILNDIKTEISDDVLSSYTCMDTENGYGNVQSETTGMVNASSKATSDMNHFLRLLDRCSPISDVLSPESTAYGEEVDDLKENEVREDMCTQGGDVFTEKQNSLSEAPCVSDMGNDTPCTVSVPKGIDNETEKNILNELADERKGLAIDIDVDESNADNLVEISFNDEPIQPNLTHQADKTIRQRDIDSELNFTDAIYTNTTENMIVISLNEDFVQQNASNQQELENDVLNQINRIRVKDVIPSTEVETETPELIKLNKRNSSTIEIVKEITCNSLSSDNVKHQDICKKVMPVDIQQEKVMKKQRTSPKSTHMIPDKKSAKLNGKGTDTLLINSSSSNIKSGEIGVQKHNGNCQNEKHTLKNRDKSYTKLQKTINDNSNVLKTSKVNKKEWKGNSLSSQGKQNNETEQKGAPRENVSTLKSTHTSSKGDSMKENTFVKKSQSAVETVNVDRISCDVNDIKKRKRKESRNSLSSKKVKTTAETESVSYTWKNVDKARKESTVEISRDPIKINDESQSTIKAKTTKSECKIKASIKAQLSDAHSVINKVCSSSERKTGSKLQKANATNSESHVLTDSVQPKKYNEPTRPQNIQALLTKVATGAIHPKEKCKTETKHTTEKECNTKKNSKPSFPLTTGTKSYVDQAKKEKLNKESHDKTSESVNKKTDKTRQDLGYSDVKIDETTGSKTIDSRSHSDQHKNKGYPNVPSNTKREKERTRNKTQPETVKSKTQTLTQETGLGLAKKQNAKVIMSESFEKKNERRVNKGKNISENQSTSTKCHIGVKEQGLNMCLETNLRQDSIKLINHEIEHSAESPEILEKRTSNVRESRDCSVTSYSPTYSPSYKCDICDELFFTSLERLQYHQKVTHNTKHDKSQVSNHNEKDTLNSANKERKVQNRDNQVEDLWFKLGIADNIRNLLSTIIEKTSKKLAHDASHSRKDTTNVDATVDGSPVQQMKQSHEKALSCQRERTGKIKNDLQRGQNQQNVMNDNKCTEEVPTEGKVESCSKSQVKTKGTRLEEKDAGMRKASSSITLAPIEPKEFRKSESLRQDDIKPTPYARKSDDATQSSTRSMPIQDTTTTTHKDQKQSAEFNSEHVSYAGLSNNNNSEQGKQSIAIDEIVTTTRPTDTQRVVEPIEKRVNAERTGIQKDLEQALKTNKSYSNNDKGETQFDGNAKQNALKRPKNVHQGAPEVADLRMKLKGSRTNSSEHVERNKRMKFPIARLVFNSCEETDSDKDSTRVRTDSLSSVDSLTTELECLNNPIGTETKDSAHCGHDAYINNNTRPHEIHHRRPGHTQSDKINRYNDARVQIPFQKTQEDGYVRRDFHSTENVVSRNLNNSSKASDDLYERERQRHESAPSKGSHMSYDTSPRRKDQNKQNSLPRSDFNKRSPYEIDSNIAPSKLTPKRHRSISSDRMERANSWKRTCVRYSDRTAYMGSDDRECITSEHRRTPKHRRSRTPERRRSRTPERRRSRTSERRRSRTPERRRSRTPERRRSRTLERRRSRSPGCRRSRTPDRRRSRTPERRRSRTPERRRSRTPERLRSRTPERRRSRSPERRRSKTPDRRRSRTPERRRSKSPERRRSKTPDRRRSRTPERRRSKSPERRRSKTSDRRRSRTPDRRRSRTPERRRSRTPERRRSRTPERRRSRTPSRSLDCRRSRSPDCRQRRTPGRSSSTESPSRSPDRRLKSVGRKIQTHCRTSKYMSPKKKFSFSKHDLSYKYRNLSFAKLSSRQPDTIINAKDHRAEKTESGDRISKLDSSASTTNVGIRNGDGKSDKSESGNIIASEDIVNELRMMRSGESGDTNEIRNLSLNDNGVGIEHNESDNKNKTKTASVAKNKKTNALTGDGSNAVCLAETDDIKNIYANEDKSVSDSVESVRKIVNDVKCKTNRLYVKEDDVVRDTIQHEKKRFSKSYDKSYANEKTAIEDKTVNKTVENETESVPEADVKIKTKDVNENNVACDPTVKLTKKPTSSESGDTNQGAMDIDDEQVSSTTLLVLCQKCGTEFQSSRELHKHMFKAHLAVFKCIKCEVGFATPGEHHDHMEQLHTPTKRRAFNNTTRKPSKDDEKVTHLGGDKDVERVDTNRDKQNTVVTTPQRKPVKKSDSYRFCFICKTLFDTRNELADHLWVRHNKRIRTFPSDSSRSKSPPRTNYRDSEESRSESISRGQYRDSGSGSPPRGLNRDSHVSGSRSPVRGTNIPRAGYDLNLTCRICHLRLNSKDTLFKHLKLKHNVGNYCLIRENMSLKGLEHL